jgi:uncharacterized circularly permuted ATP-grasp superfamily protein
MTPERFTYWLQGFAEISGDQPIREQWQTIKDHLSHTRQANLHRSRSKHSLRALHHTIQTYAATDTEHLRSYWQPQSSHHLLGTRRAA